MRFVFLYEMFELGMYWRVLQSVRSSITISADSAGFICEANSITFFICQEKEI